MKYLIALLLLFKLSYAQNSLKINYVIKYNTEIYNEKTGTLLLDIKNQKSVFYISKSHLKKELLKDDNKINVFEKEIERHVTVDVAADSMLFKEKINNETFIVAENIPKIEWLLHSERSKKIDNYICFQATTTFRGRNYTAWYSLEFPVFFGPWKFNGLPGLIMEIYDDANRYYWGVTAIQYTNEEINLPDDQKMYQNIDLKKYVVLRYDKVMNQIDARLPRGTVTQIIKAERNGIEKKFEWEE